jgi:hypothetical protein
MKEGADGRFRRMTNPNKLVQDGPKFPLLCKACEGRFSIRESWFSQNVFLPLVRDGHRPQTYDPQLFYFLISLAWRMLCVPRSIPPEERELTRLIAAADQDWRAFLLEEKPLPEQFQEAHLFIAEPESIRRLPVPNQELYFACYTDGTIVSCRDHLGWHLIYVKIPRFLFFFPLMPLGPAAFLNTAIDPRGGDIPDYQEIRHDWVGGIIVQRASEVHDQLQSRSPKQKEKDWESLHEHPNSDWARAVAADERALLRAALRPRSRQLPLGVFPQPASAGRNDPCPCRSGKKFKRCCGRAR